MRILLFLLIGSSILGLAYFYIGWRVIRPARIRRRHKVAAWSALFSLLVVLPANMAMRRNGIEGTFSDALAWLGYLGLGVACLAFTFLLMRDLLRLVAALGRWIRRLLGGARASAAAAVAEGRGRRVDLGRRRLLAYPLDLGILGVSAGLAGYGLAAARGHPAVVEVEVALATLPPALDGFRLVQITDIHVGPTIKRPFVESVVETVNGLRPDLIALTGDLVDGSVAYLRDDVAPLAELSARHGAYFVTGNHEYYSGVEPWLEHVDRLGFTVLLNEHRVVNHRGERLVLAGVTDFRAGRHLAAHATDVAAALRGAPASVPRLLLAHQPKSIFEAARLGIDLQISGHTHGGQFFPGNLLASLGQPYIAGLARHERSWIYVSRGTGYWGPPMRLAAPAEITVITLRKPRA